MRVYSATCPHCKQSVDTTAEKLGEPIICPSCGNPFEMDIPSAAVEAVQERDTSESTESDKSNLAGEMEERKLLTAHPVMFRAHPFRFSGLLLLLGLGLFGIAQSLLGIVAGWSSPIILWIGVALVIAALVAFVIWWLHVLNVTLTITESRTILKRGIIARETSEVQHDNVRNIQCDQSIWERLLSYGDIGISSAGQDDLEIVAHEMPQPEQVVELIRENQR